LSVATPIRHDPSVDRRIGGQHDAAVARKTKDILEADRPAFGRVMARENG
jgi:hypothetical protein